MQERELEISGGSLYYGLEDGKAVITRFQGESSEAELPGHIEELPVKAIGKKAFLSRKNLRRVILPDSIEEIGDWAFAYCGGLKEVRLPDGAVRFGKAVFMECGSLESLSGTRAQGELLAAAVTALDANYLLDVRGAGSEEWLAKWDSRLLAIMRVPDSEGYSRQVLCGEEDYGSTDFAAYTSASRKRKARLAFLRLLFPQGLSDENRAFMETYLREHTRGSGEGDEAWQVLLSERGEDRRYYRLFAELGCVTEDNFDGILADIGEKYTEMKAFFLRFREETMGTGDFFALLEL